MKTYLKLLAFVGVCSLSLTSCKDDDSKDEFYNNELNYESLTSFNTYYLKNIQADSPIDIKGNGIKSVDVFNQLDNCKKDDVYYFLNQQNTISNGNWAFANDEGLTKCASTDPQRISEGTFTINGKTLTLKDKNVDRVFENTKLEKFKGTDGATEGRLTFDYYIQNVKVHYTFETTK